MTDLRKAAEMALEVLKQSLGYSNEAQERIKEAKQALRQALAQPEQEPVAWMCMAGTWYGTIEKRFYLSLDGTENLPPMIPLYTAPPRREWVDLTEEDWKSVSYTSDNFIAGAEWARSKLKEKNA